MGNLVLLTPAYTAFQARIAIVLQSVTTFITSPLRTHRGVIPARRRKSVSSGAGLTDVADVADDVGVVVASQVVNTEDNPYLKSLFL